jgi:DNA polymerase
MAKFKRILVLDFETYFDSKTFTLKKLTTEQYIRSPDFKVHGVCVKDYLSSEPSAWYKAADADDFFNSVDWQTTAVLAHNAQFDVSILSWYYGYKPAFIFDSLSMARALFGTEQGNSLAALATRFNLPEKGKALMSVDGVRDLTPEQEKELAEYCAHDTWLCEQIFIKLQEDFPPKELRLIDLTLKMYTDPVLDLDPELLMAAIQEEEQRRTTLLNRLAIEEKDLASNPKFAEILRGLGVEPPMKNKRPTAKTPNPVGKTLALAKNDAGFQALLNSENEDIASLCEARLMVKSTLERTRAQRFIDIATRGCLPVPLNYYGAHTGRWSASRGSGINLQNLKRGSALRRAIMAPMGYTLVVCDLSQIEPRVLSYLADDIPMLEIFRSGEDAYAAFGAQMFGIPNLTKDTHPELRQSAKSALLGAGYGLGWASFAAQLLTGFLGAPPIRYDGEFAKQVGVDEEDFNDFVGWKKNLEKLAEIPHTCSKKELLMHALCSKKIIDKYRDASSQVVSFWEMCNGLIKRSLHEGKERTHKCLTFKKDSIQLPSGLYLRYPDTSSIEGPDGKKQWVYGPNKIKLYGGKLTENIVQAVARCIMTDGMLRIQKRYPCVLTVHDEVVALVPEEEAQEAELWVWRQMTIEPEYMPGIPLNAETGAARRYGDAK